MTDADDPDPDPERVALLRAVADDIRGDSTESEQVANLLYRVSDVYDADEDTDVRDVYVNMKRILRVVESGGMGDDDGD
jgi:hypothetical protein